MQKIEPSTEEGVLGEHFIMRGPQGRRTDRSMMDCAPAIINHTYMLHLWEKANDYTCFKTQRPKEILPQILLYYLFIFMPKFGNYFIFLFFLVQKLAICWKQWDNLLLPEMLEFRRWTLCCSLLGQLKCCKLEKKCWILQLLKDHSSWSLTCLCTRICLLQNSKIRFKNRWQRSCRSYLLWIHYPLYLTCLWTEHEAYQDSCYS